MEKLRRQYQELTKRVIVIKFTIYRYEFKEQLVSVLVHA